MLVANAAGVSRVTGSEAIAMLLMIGTNSAEKQSWEALEYLSQYKSTVPDNNMHHQNMPISLKLSRTHLFLLSTSHVSCLQLCLAVSNAACRFLQLLVEVGHLQALLLHLLP